MDASSKNCLFVFVIFLDVSVISYNANVAQPQTFSSTDGHQQSDINRVTITKCYTDLLIVQNCTPPLFQVKNYLNKKVRKCGPNFFATIHSNF